MPIRSASSTSSICFRNISSCVECSLGVVVDQIASFMAASSDGFLHQTGARVFRLQGLPDPSTNPHTGGMTPPTLSPRIRETFAAPIPTAKAWEARYDGSAGPTIDLTQAVPGYPTHPDLALRLAEGMASPVQ